MLSMLGWQTAPLPFVKKTLHKPQKSPMMNADYVSRNTASQPRAPISQTVPSYFVYTTSATYAVDPQRTAYGHAGHVTSKVTPTVKQSNPLQPHNNSKNSNASVNRPFHIVPDGVTPDSFIYERSEDAESDTLTCYSNSSTDTLMQSVTTATSSTLSNSLSGKPALLVKGLISDVSKIPTPNSPHSDPVSLPPPTSSNPQNQKPSHSENLSRPRSGSGDSGSSRRRGSGSDSERPMSMGPSSTRVDLPRPGATNRFSIVPTAGQSSVTNSRDIPPTRRDTDHRMQAESSRSRRLSGPVIPTGFGLLPGERVPATVHDSFVPSTLGTLDRHSPPGPGPALRTAPSGEGGKRERFSPDREMTAASEIVHERRPNGPGPVQIPPSNNFYDRERGPTRRGSQSSGSSRGHSPQDEVPRNSTYAMGPTGPIRSRTISTSRRDGSPKQIVIGGLDGTAQGIGRTVRFSERLVCPSPIPMEKRRRGWFNKKGDQLWTNDGVYVPPEMGCEYPIDLEEYPDVGTGWQNEEGVRIDMQHRLIPKVPLRPALKRSSSSQQQITSTRPDGRVFFHNNLIREE